MSCCFGRKKNSYSFGTPYEKQESSSYRNSVAAEDTCVSTETDRSSYVVTKPVVNNNKTSTHQARDTPQSRQNGPPPPPEGAIEPSIRTENHEVVHQSISIQRTERSSPSPPPPGGRSSPDSSEGRRTPEQVHVSVAVREVETIVQRPEETKPETPPRTPTPTSETPPRTPTPRSSTSSDHGHSQSAVVQAESSQNETTWSSYHETTTTTSTTKVTDDDGFIDHAPTIISSHTMFTESSSGPSIYKDGDTSTNPLADDAGSHSSHEDTRDGFSHVTHETHEEHVIVNGTSDAGSDDVHHVIKTETISVERQNSDNAGHEAATIEAAFDMGSDDDDDEHRTHAEPKFLM